MHLISLRRGVLAVLLFAMLPACGPNLEPALITEKRVVRQISWSANPELSPRVRFRIDPDPRMSQGSASAAAAGDTLPGSQIFDWVVPEGWQARGETSFRSPHFEVPSGDPGVAGVTCYVTTIAGGGGGFMANVNRWRGELGLAPAAEADFRDPPTTWTLGVPAPLVDIEGDFKNRRGEEIPSARLLGVILATDKVSVTVKMIGPRAAVTAEEDRFRAFCASLRARHRYLWELPEGWVERPDVGGMRLATLQVGEGTECSLVELAGDGGGLALNFNRWDAEFGGDGLSESELAACERIQVLGAESVLFAAEGTYTGSMDERGARPDHAGLGLFVPLGRRSLYVKMVGPRAEVLPQRQAFLAFVQSLREQD